MAVPRQLRRINLPLVVAWAIFATYVLAARGVRNMFPISVFDMYQAHAPDVVARVLAIDARGRARQIDAFDGFVCQAGPPPLTQLVQICGERHRPLEYVARDQSRFIADHVGADAGPESIIIVSRAYLLTGEPGAPAFEDCTLVRCSAHLREDLR